MIGIDSNTWLVYEGASTYGHAVWPAPVISFATLIESDSDWERIPAGRHLSDAKLIFREDSFDPVTRVRRGRLYEWTSGVLQDTWHIPPHPATPTDRHGMTDDGLLHRSLYTYRPAWNLLTRLENPTRFLLVLGTRTAPTVWRVISAETVASGDELLTLQARSTFGFLPELITEAVPQIALQEVEKIIESVASAAFRSSAASLIDLCRAAITVVLAKWLAATGDAPNDIDHWDVGQLLKEVERRHPAVNDYAAVKAAVKIQQVFHSRGKPNEQKRYGTRPPSDEDAQLVLQALGFVLREIGWAR